MKLSPAFPLQITDHGKWENKIVSNSGYKDFPKSKTGSIVVQHYVHGVYGRFPLHNNWVTPESIEHFLDFFHVDRIQVSLSTNANLFPNDRPKSTVKIVATIDPAG